MYIGEEQNLGGRGLQHNLRAGKGRGRGEEKSSEPHLTGVDAVWEIAVELRLI